MTSLSAHCCKVGAEERAGRRPPRPLWVSIVYWREPPKEVLQAGCWCDRKGREWTLGADVLGPYSPVFAFSSTPTGAWHTGACPEAV